MFIQIKMDMIHVKKIRIVRKETVNGICDRNSDKII